MPPPYKITGDAPSLLIFISMFRMLENSYILALESEEKSAKFVIVNMEEFLETFMPRQNKQLLWSVNFKDTFNVLTVEY